MKKIKETTIGSFPTDGMYGQYLPIIPNPETNIPLGWTMQPDVENNVRDINDLFEIIIKRFTK